MCPQPLICREAETCQLTSLDLWCGEFSLTLFPLAGVDIHRKIVQHRFIAVYSVVMLLEPVAVLEPTTDLSCTFYRDGT